MLDPKVPTMLHPKILMMKVLVLDDMESLRTAMVKALQALGFSDITTAEDGLDGLEKVTHQLKSKPFELIFCDVKMPRCDGIQFLKTLKTLEHCQATPVIMVTSEADVGTVLDAITAGAKSYVLKPTDTKTLERKILEVFTGKAEVQK